MHSSYILDPLLVSCWDNIIYPVLYIEKMRIRDLPRCIEIGLAISCAPGHCNAARQS